MSISCRAHRLAPKLLSRLPLRQLHSKSRFWECSRLVVAAPILFRANMPSVAANSTLKCYDGGGNYEPCATRANASRSQFNGRPSTHQPLSWTTTALYQQTIWPTTSLDKSAIWPATAVDEPADWTTSPAAPRSSTSRKRPALVTRRRRLVPCFFSALRRGFTQIAS